MKPFLLIVAMSFTGIFLAQQNQGSLKGHLAEDETGYDVLGAHVILYSNDSTVFKSVISNIDGNYLIADIPAGDYSVEFRFIGFDTQKYVKVTINPAKTTVLNHLFKTKNQVLESVVVKGKVTRKDVQKVQVRSANVVAACYSSASGGIVRKGRRKSKSKSYRKPIDTGNGNVSKSRNKYSEFEENDFVKVATEALSTFSIDVDNASYSIIRKQINDGITPPTESVRIEEMINYFKYKYDAPQNGEAFAVLTEVTDSPWSQNKIVKIGLKGKTFENEKAPKNNLVFLLDVSGSMSSENKLGYVKKSMKMLVKSLTKNDKVSIVTYAGYTATPLKPTSCDQIDKIITAIDGLSSGGSTNGEGGINQAYDLAEKHFMKNGNNRIILCTDGDFNVGVSSNSGLEKLIEKKRKSGVFLTVCGFGMGNLQDQYMETLADKGNGNYYYIDNLLEAKKVFQEDFTATIHTIAKDVKIQVEFNPTHVKSYRLIGYDNRMLKKEDFLDDTKDAGELGAGHTVTALYEVVMKTDDEAFNNGLKYQNSTIKEGYENELLTVKLRYKKPDEKKSQGFEVPVQYEPNKSLSEDFQFILAVAEFGLILRKSEFKGNANLDHALEFARAGKGSDANGYRAEFIRLVEMYQVNLAEK